jgi:Protein of unknown function (DUF2851)
MSESFLHYIWLHQYFDKSDLHTTAGEPLVVFKQGTLNTHAGPDFLASQLVIGDLQWAGNVEIHVKSSAWHQHRHQEDEAYENVILHVVWEDDQPVQRMDGSFIPTLILKGRVQEKLMAGFRSLMNSAHSIPCASQLTTVPVLVIHSMMDRALIHRLEKKSEEVLHLLKLNVGDWEETAYQLLLRNFGFKVNADPFFQLAKRLPVKILRKHQNNILAVEALLFGQAGFLTSRTRDPFVQELFKEHFFLSRKYQLQEEILSPALWKFLRLRPANFPTIRLAQVAAVICSQPSIFSSLIELRSLKNLAQFLNQKLSTYWLSHYRFGVKAKKAVSGLGQSSMENIVINTVVPLLVAYSRYHDDITFLDQATHWLEQLKPENNRITRLWKEVGVNPQHSFDSQAEIELYNHFCLKRNCLRCNIGANLLKPL